MKQILFFSPVDVGPPFPPADTIDGPLLGHKPTTTTIRCDKP